MSSTSVHSEQENIQIVGGQTIPTKEGIEIPPKSYGKGPSTLDVIQGETLKISVGDSELLKNGQLVAKDGTKVAQFPPEAVDAIEANRRKRITAREEVKGEDR